MVDAAAAGQLTYQAIPIRVLSVIDHVVRAEALEQRDLSLARRDRHHPRAENFCKL